MHPHVQRSGNRFARVLGVLLVVLLMAGIGPQVAPAVAQRAGDPPLDLAAIALTPADLEAAGLEGFGVGVSVMGDAGTAAGFLTDWRADPDGVLADAIADAAPIRAHGLGLGKPIRADDPRSPTARTVFSHTYEFADEDAAAAAFATLASGWETETARAEPTRIDVGEESVFFREDGFDPTPSGPGNPYRRADLLFRSGRLVLGVSLSETNGNAPREEEVEALAERLFDLIDPVLDGDAPGLSTRVVRLDVPYEPLLILQVDRYNVIDGEALRAWGETDEQLADRQARVAEGDLIDYHYVGQPVPRLTADPDLSFFNHVYRFESDEAASAWREASIGGLSERGSTDVRPVDDPPDLADETVGVSYVNPAGLAVWRLDIRHGSLLSTVVFRGSTLAPRELLDKVATAQAACMAKGACLDPLPVGDETAAVDGPDGAVPLDLAAMTLVPGDLDAERLPGYGVAFGETTFLDAAAASLAEAQGLTEEEVRETLDAAGFVRRYDNHLYLPADAGDPAGTAGRMAVSYVLEFADEEGAAAAWEVTEDESGNAAAEDVARVDDFGEQSEATRVHGEDAATGEPWAQLDLTFRLENLHVGVAIVDWTGDEPPLAEAEALADRLLARVEAGLAGDVPGLGSQVSRVGGAAVVPSADYYLLQDGEALPLYGEAAADTEGRAEAAARFDQTDVYQLWQQVAAGGEATDDDVWYLVELLQFTDAEAASDWLAGMEDRIGGNAGFEAFTIDGEFPVFGDESISYTLAAAEGGARYRGVALRVGDTVASIDVVAPETPPADAVAALADAQADCLVNGGCVEPVLLPDDLWAIQVESDGGRFAEIHKDPAGQVERSAADEPDGGAVAGGETYVSEAFDYTVSWDPETWVALPESDDDGIELHIVGSVLVMVRMTGVEDYGGDADACLAGIVESSQPDEEDDAPLVPAEGRQAPATVPGATGALYDIGTFGVAYYECRTLVEGESVLQIRFVAPARAYDLILPALEELLAGIEVGS